MKTNILATAAALSDGDLLARLTALAGREREASVELVAHLAALDSRPSVYAAQGYGSLFAYCTQALRLSEDAACNRIEAARACRRFPVILESLASGAMALTSVRLLGRHLTPENHQAVLAKAMGRSRREIEALLAELAPTPDVPTSVRRLSIRAATLPSSATAGPSATGVASEPVATIAPSPAALVASSRPIVQATAPERYRVQFTIGQETHEKLRRLQGLLLREIPDGDPGAIFDRAITLLLEKVEKRKLGAAAKPRPQTRSALTLRPPGGQARGVAPRRRPVRLRCFQRTEVLGADLSGIPSRAGACETGASHRCQHRSALPPPQPIRGRADLRASRRLDRA